MLAAWRVWDREKLLGRFDNPPPVQPDLDHDDQQGDDGRRHMDIAPGSVIFQRQGQPGRDHPARHQDHGAAKHQTGI